MKTIPAVLAIWVLLLPGGCLRPATVERPEIRHLEQESPVPRESEQKTVASVVLTNERPVASFPVSQEILAAAPPVLEISVTKVVNPTETPVAIFVYLAPVVKKGQAEPEKILVGNFSLYPPDQPGNFLLRATKAFSELRARHQSSSSTEIRVVFELKRLRETQPSTPLEITIGAPKWGQEEPKSH